MPELPEVQTTVNQIADYVKGQIISSAWMDPRKSINTGSNLSWRAMRARLSDKKIASTGRRAKFIILNFTDGSALWIHQKMTGHLLTGKWSRKGGVWLSQDHGPLASDPTNHHIRFMLTFQNGRQLALSDARRFARIILVRSADEAGHIKEIAHLGPEPLTLNRQDFESALRSKRGLIKTVMTDPVVIAGIGNIYADEILHRAGVHPFTPVPKIGQAEMGKIYRALNIILAAAIKAGGSSISDYRTPKGIAGHYQEQHKAYQRAGRKCLLCRHGIIQRIVRNGRSSHFCPAHQVLS